MLFVANNFAAGDSAAARQTLRVDRAQFDFTSPSIEACGRNNTLSRSVNRPMIRDHYRSRDQCRPR
jgi:hypothetical protein